VPGIGPKTAAKLIQKYGSAEAVLEHADELSPKQAEKVKAFAEQLPVTRELVTLRRDAPVELALDACAPGRFTWAEVLPIFQELGFRKLIEQLPNVADETVAELAEHQPSPDDRAAALRQPERGDYAQIDTPEKLAALAERLRGLDSFTFDTETTGLKAVDAELVGLAIAWDVGQAAYVPTMCQYGRPLPLEQVQAALGPIFADTKIQKIGHNLKYDLIVMRHAGLPVAGPAFDTMVAAFLVDPARVSYGLDRLVRDLLGHEMIPITELIGKGRDQLRMDQVPLEHVAEYAAEDADYTHRLAALFEPQLAEQQVERLFYETEMPLLGVLTEMEAAGIAIDADFLAEMSTRLTERAGELTQQVHTVAGQAFNLDSPKQLGEVLFDKLGFRVVRRTKTARSTDAETLGVLARETGHDLPQLLLDYRELQKLLSTYVDALPKERSRRTGRVHTSYHQTGAITGRLSSSEPNLQNIPVRTELGRQIRRAFVPRSRAERLIVADYSQVELRVLAHFSADDALRQAFEEDRDIHAFVAAQVNGVDEADVTREMRGNAKAVNFGIVYGQTAFGLAQTTGMSREEAQQFIDEYFARYPKIRAFIDECVDNAKRYGYAKTLLGRRRPIENIRSRNANLRNQAERLAVNTVVQGSAADIIKIAMVQLHQRIAADGLPLRILLQVHDELVCEAPADEAESLAAVVSEQMGAAVDLSVPLKVDVAIGQNWFEAK
jgi:DNA polymerase-1